MGSFSQDAATSISGQNPAGTAGFAFVEFAHPEPAKLRSLFERLGFSLMARHRKNGALLFRQGEIDFLLSGSGTRAARFASRHGPSVPAMGFRVVDAHHAFAHAVSHGAKPAGPTDGTPTLKVPAIEGIGGSLIYLVERCGEDESPYDAEFKWLDAQDRKPEGLGLFYLDHLTHNVHRGRMDAWTDFYRCIFNFHQIHYFDIEGQMTGLFSRALASPDGRIRIPINESADDRSQIEEYLEAYNGEGIQHIALGCRDIYSTVPRLRANGLPFMPSRPATYYERIAARLPGHRQNVSRLQESGILIDGEAGDSRHEAQLLLQIFSANVIGPVFFEFIERRGNDGFGEGNFRALFESIEEDQIRRGVLATPNIA